MKKYRIFSVVWVLSVFTSGCFDEIGSLVDRGKKQYESSKGAGKPADTFGTVNGKIIMQDRSSPTQADVVFLYKGSPLVDRQGTLYPVVHPKEDGSFSALVPEYSYELSVSAAGFTQTKQPITLSAGVPLTMDQIV